MKRPKLWRPPPSWKAGSWKQAEWVSLNAAFALVKERTRSRDLAAHDLHEHMSTAGELKSALQIAPTPAHLLSPRIDERRITERFILKPEFWRRVEMFPRATNPEQLTVRAGKGQPPWAGGSWYFFVRRADLNKLYPEAAFARDALSSAGPRRTPGPHPELRWRTALARELIRRARAREPDPTAVQMWELVQDKNGSPDLRTVQTEMKKLLS